MEFIVSNRQRRVAVDTEILAKGARKALPLCEEAKGAQRAVLPQLEEIVIVLLSDRSITEVNRRFLLHEGPTDVITFDHGEILLGVQRAKRNAEEYGNRLEDELILYIIHGLLHLNGWSDKIPVDAMRMQSVQERILKQITFPS